MIVQPYLCFEGRCAEALAFYQSAIGAEIEMSMRFDENPDPGGMACGDGDMPQPPGDKILHASFRVGETQLMASDGMCSGNAKFEGISLSLTARDEAEADRLFGALGEGGQVLMPLGKTFFSPRFGMVTDRFGVCWMVIVPGEMPGN